MGRKLKGAQWWTDNEVTGYFYLKILLSLGHSYCNLTVITVINIIKMIISESFEQSQCFTVYCTCKTIKMCQILTYFSLNLIRYDYQQVLKNYLLTAAHSKMTQKLNSTISKKAGTNSVRGQNNEKKTL